MAVLSVLSVGVPWEKYFQPAYWIIPILDFAAIALLYRAVQPDVTGTLLLTVFPVFWLAWSGFAPRTAHSHHRWFAADYLEPPLMGTQPSAQDFAARSWYPSSCCWCTRRPR